GDIADLFVPVFAVLGYLRELVVHPGCSPVGIDRFFAAEEVAGDICRVFPASLERSAVGAAGCQFDLGYRSVFAERNRLEAGLPAEVRAIGVPVVENVPLAVYLNNAAVV